jgi:hypothetical protein
LSHENASADATAWRRLRVAGWVGVADATTAACAGCMKIAATAAESRRIARMRRKQSTKTRVQILHTEPIKHLIYNNNPPYPSWVQWTGGRPLIDLVF